MENRVLVIGTYLNKKTYILRTLDGKTFKVIKEGEHFKIGITTYYPFREQRKNGNGTIISCRRINKNRQIRNSIPLIHNRYMWWALNTEALQNGGLFIPITYPFNPSECEKK